MIIQYFRTPTVAEIEAQTGLKVKRISTGQIKVADDTFKEGTEIEFENDLTADQLKKLDAALPSFTRAKLK
jgi:hypothetical protein